MDRSKNFGLTNDHCTSTPILVFGSHCLHFSAFLLVLPSYYYITKLFQCRKILIKDTQNQLFFSIIKKVLVLRSSNIILRKITRLMKLSDECIFSCQLRNQFHCAVDWNGTHAQQATSRYTRQPGSGKQGPIRDIAIIR